MKEIPSFDSIKFDASAHRYTTEAGQELTGVTRFIQQFQKPFDRDTIAARVAEREGRPVEDVLQEWDAKGKASIALGSMVHEYIEAALKGQNVNQDDPFLSLNSRATLPEILAFDGVWPKMRAAMKICAVEKVIGDETLGLAGIIDCLMFSEKTGKYHLVDWKTGKFDTYNWFEYLLSPFEDDTASKLNVYSLQLSLYRLILERAGLELGDSYIVHLSAAGAQTYKATDYRAKFELFFEAVPF